jgi:ankyrin repeat protein
MVVPRNDEFAIRYLLARGANPSLCAKLRSGEDLVLKRPLPNSGWMLNEAAMVCSPEIFALLLEHGARIDGVDAVPLHFAAGQGPSPYGVPYSDRIPMLEYLVGLGLDVNAVDDAIKIADDGRGQHGAPLEYAVMWGRVREARWLLEHGADPDKKTWGRSARDRVNSPNLPSDHGLKALFRSF